MEWDFMGQGMDWWILGCKIGLHTAGAKTNDIAKQFRQNAGWHAFVTWLGQLFILHVHEHNFELPWLWQATTNRTYTQFVFIELIFFVKKIPLFLGVGYVMDRSMDRWVSEWEMYVCHTNQIGSTINSQSNFLL